jgi:hypothetical protein
MKVRIPWRTVISASCVAFTAHAQSKTSRCAFSADRFRSDSIPNVGDVLFAGGTVVIRCPDRGITIRGDSAERYPDRDQMVGHAVYDEPRFHVTSDYLTYFGTQDHINASGNVHASLPSGSTLVGPAAANDYNSPKRLDDEEDGHDDCRRRSSTDGRR